VTQQQMNKVSIADQQKSKMSNSLSYKTTCCYCGVGCGIVVNKHRNGKLHGEGDKDPPVKKGMF